MDIRIIDGRLTKDAELRQTSDGRKYVTFSIANNSFVKNQQVTTYFNVVTFNSHDVEHYDKLTKGKLVIVNGKPNEVMAVRDGKTYLNRNIMAYNIEGSFYGNKETKDGNQTMTYKDVAPLAPNVEVPKPESFHKDVSNKPPIQGGEYAMVNNSTSRNINDDDLPF